MTFRDAVGRNYFKSNVPGTLIRSFGVDSWLDVARSYQAHPNKLVAAAVLPIWPAVSWTFPQMKRLIMEHGLLNNAIGAPRHELHPRIGGNLLMHMQERSFTVGALPAMTDFALPVYLALALFQPGIAQGAHNVVLPTLQFSQDFLVNHSLLFDAGVIIGAKNASNLLCDIGGSVAREVTGVFKNKKNREVPGLRVRDRNVTRSRRRT